jgi:hypothetical protein
MWLVGNPRGAAQKPPIFKISFKPTYFMQVLYASHHARNSGYKNKQEHRRIRRAEKRFI